MLSHQKSCEGMQGVYNGRFALMKYFSAEAWMYYSYSVMTD